MDKRQLMITLVFWQNFLARVKAACDDEPLPAKTLAAWWSLWSDQLDEEDRLILRHLLDEVAMLSAATMANRQQDMKDLVEDVCHLLIMKYYGRLHGSVIATKGDLLSACHETALQWLYQEYDRRAETPVIQTAHLFAVLTTREPNPG